MNHGHVTFDLGIPGTFYCIRAGIFIRDGASNLDNVQKMPYDLVMP